MPTIWSSAKTMIKKMQESALTTDLGEVQTLPKEFLNANYTEKGDLQNLQIEKKKPLILPVGGGKGGIGKSMLTANIAIRLAALGRKVSVVDLDLGAANLHTCLGVPQPQIGMSDFFHGQVGTFAETGIKPDYVKDLTVYGGNLDFWQKIRLFDEQKLNLISSLNSLDADYVLLDLGAGTHTHTLDFFIFSDAGLLVVVPEPTSIENAYVFMKNVMFRKVKNICEALSVPHDIEAQILEKISTYNAQTTPFDELKKLAQENTEFVPNIVKWLERTKIGIIINQVRTVADRELGASMAIICNRYFGFHAHFIGPMRYDDSVWKSIRIRKPLIIDYPHGVGAANIYSLVDSILTRFESSQKIDEFSRAS